MRFSPKNDWFLPPKHWNILFRCRFIRPCTPTRLIKAISPLTFTFCSSVLRFNVVIERRFFKSHYRLKHWPFDIMSCHPDYGQSMKVPTTISAQYVQIQKKLKRTSEELWKSIHSIHDPCSTSPTFTSKNLTTSLLYSSCAFLYRRNWSYDWFSPGK